MSDILVIAIVLFAIGFIGNALAAKSFKDRKEYLDKTKDE